LPSEILQKPIVAEGIAAETDVAARRLFTTPQQRFLRLIRNQPVELLPPVDSMESLWQDSERVAVENKLGAAIIASDITVKAGLERLVRDTAADEVIVVTDTYAHADRLQSYQRVVGVAAMIEVKPTEARRDPAAGRTVVGQFEYSQTGLMRIGVPHYLHARLGFCHPQTRTAGAESCHVPEMRDKVLHSV
jgi:hypothetical protein